MKTCDIQIRDPFVVPEPRSKRYLMYGSTDSNIWTPPATGFDVWESPDLKDWTGPIAAFRPPPDFWADRNFWAPEVHEYRRDWYMFASFKSPDRCRGTQILVGDTARGPFRPHSLGPVTPPDWECLDGTLYIDASGAPWMVFCHEWVQIGDGTICALRLSDDLTRSIGPPETLFAASSAPWVEPIRGGGNYVTDGPFLFPVGDALAMIWSSFRGGAYAIGVSYSESGVTGPWTHEETPLYQNDGGHGMVFRDFSGTLYLAIHTPNRTPHERAIFLPLEERGGKIMLA
ncbi:MAG: glycoside hydrolase family 43 protein [Spirochaetaceae bacterium]